MDEILSKKHYRRTFYIVVFLVLALAIIVRFLVLPRHAGLLETSWAIFFSTLLDNLIASIFVTVFIGSFIFWLRPEIVKRSNIEILGPKQINPLLKTATTTSKFWIYKGACGRYTRATTLPKFAEAARNQGLGRDITICILNPKNVPLCTEYATYRRSLKTAKSGTPWTCQSVQEEVIATAITALKFLHTEPLLRIRVFLIDNFSAFRLDISDIYVVITKEDKEACALKADAGTYFYDSYKDDVRLTERQAIELKCCGNIDLSGTVSEALLKNAIKCADLADEALLETFNLATICKLINYPSDPY
jgi:hypothetical protein